MWYLGRRIALLALRRKADSVLVVFDAATFSPLPGSEFARGHDFAADVPAWLDALDALRPPEGVALLAASTQSPGPVAVGEGKWRPALGDALSLRWWEREELERFEPAPVWIARLLASAPGRCPSSSRAT